MRVRRAPRPSALQYLSCSGASYGWRVELDGQASADADGGGTTYLAAYAPPAVERVRPASVATENLASAFTIDGEHFGEPDGTCRVEVFAPGADNGPAIALPDVSAESVAQSAISSARRRLARRACTARLVHTVHVTVTGQRSVLAAHIAVDEPSVTSISTVERPQEAPCQPGGWRMAGLTIHGRSFGRWVNGSSEVRIISAENVVSACEVDAAGLYH